MRDVDWSNFVEKLFFLTKLATLFVKLLARQPEGCFSAPAHDIHNTQ